MDFISLSKNLVFVFLLTLLFCAPTLTFAQEFMPLVRIPGLDNATDLNAYVNALYSLSISIAALIAVVKIVLAGAKYMLTDLVTDKGAAKKDIWNALIGLLIIIGAWLILNTINSDLTNPNILIDTVDNSVPEQVDWAGYCSEIDADGGSCLVGSCSGNTGVGATNSWMEEGSFFSPQNTTCQSRCAELEGLYDQARNQCFYDERVYNDFIETGLNAVVAEDCPAGASCEATECEPPFNFGQNCRSQCEVVKKGIYNEGTQACTTVVSSTAAGIDEPPVNQREAISVNPNTTYKVDDPAFDSEPAGPLHNKTIIISADAYTFENMVYGVSVDGEEMVLGCMLFAPAVCN